MDRFFAPTVESIGPRPSVQAPGDGLRGHYKAILNSVPSNGSCLVVVPGLDPLHHLEANCPTNATGSIGDEVFVGFDDEKSLWVVTPRTHTTEINGVTVPLTGSAWITPTLINSWANIGVNNPAEYLKDPLGFVHLKGRIGSGAVGSVAFTLPIGYRPGNDNDYWPMIYGNFVSQLAAVIGRNGNVLIAASSGTTISDASLAGITFLAEN